MRRTYLLFCLLLLGFGLVSAQNVGIGTAVPNTKLDIRGDFAFRTATINLINGQNHNVPISASKFSYYRVTGATAVFGITGLDGGSDGKVLVLLNATNFPLIIYNNNASSLAANRILTGYGTDLTLSSYGSVSLQYNSTDNRWVVNSLNSSAMGDWNLLGNAGTNPLVNFLGTTDNQPLLFKTNNIEHVRITPQGRIGINAVSPMGTYYPFHRIEIQDSNGLNSDIVIRTSSAGGFNGVPAWVSMKSNGRLQQPTKVNYGDYLGEHFYYAHDGSWFRLAAAMDVNMDSTTGNMDVPTRFSFWTTENGQWFPQERVRITNEGNVWFANGKSMLSRDQNGSIELGARDSLSTSLGTPYIDFHWNNLAQNYNVRMINNDNRQLEIKFDDGLGTLKVNGTVIANCGTLVCSDMRYKTQIHLISNVLSQLQSLNAYTYKWKQSDFPGKGFDESRQIGVLAQELEQVFPELVVTDKQGYKAVDYARLSAVLLQAVKEQQQLIEQQQQQISTLQQNQADIISRLEKLEAK